MAVPALALRLPEISQGAAENSIGGDPFSHPEAAERQPFHKRHRKRILFVCFLNVALVIGLGLGFGYFVYRAILRRRVTRGAVTLQLKVPATGLTSELGAALRCACLHLNMK
jgi:hypothetical protein